MITPMVDVDGGFYVDGGVSDSVPLGHAMKMGYKKAVVILTRNRDYRKGPSPRMDRIWRHYFRNYPKLAEALSRRYVLYNRQMDRVDRLEAEGKIFVLRPGDSADFQSRAQSGKINGILPPWLYSDDEAS